MTPTPCPMPVFPIAFKSNLVERHPFQLSILAMLLCFSGASFAQQSPIDPYWVQQPRLPDLPPLSQQSQLPDVVQFRIGQSVEHDSNIFRLPASNSRQSDTYGVTTLGLKFDKRYSLQRIELDLNAQDFRYQHSTALDFTALNYAAAWRWNLTPRLTGNVTADRREYLDSTTLVQTTGSVNRRTDEANLIDAEYEVGAAWRLLGGVFDRTIKNSAALIQEADTQVSGGEAGAKFVFRSGDFVAYRYRQGNGEYSGLPGSAVPSRNFTDKEHELSFEWLPASGTSLQGRVSHLNRKRDDATSSELSGLVGRLNLNWVITGKTRMDVGLIRELVSYQPSTLSYYDGDRFYISPVWKPTEKTAIRLRLDQGIRHYNGVLGYEGRRDVVGQAGVSVEWDPLRFVKLIASLAHDKRTSNFAGLDYKANVLGVTALFSF
jgi:exopolysaccharide biosynthesis operon protein EpsL